MYLPFHNILFKFYTSGNHNGGNMRQGNQNCASVWNLNGNLHESCSPGRMRVPRLSYQKMRKNQLFYLLLLFIRYIFNHLPQTPVVG